MQNDQEVYAEIIKNNPFWDIYDSQFEILIPPGSLELPEIAPPDIPTSTEAYISYTFFLVIAFIWFIINRKSSKINFPAINFDEKEQWYYYQFNGEKSQWLKGDENWLPLHYYFDKNQGAFYYSDGHNESIWVSIEELNQASIDTSESTPSVLFPVLLIIAGFFGTNLWFGSSDSEEYEEFLALQEQREYELSLFDPFEDMCNLSNRNALIPQQMTVRVLYDLPEGSNLPIAVESYSYLEGDTLRTPNGEISLPSLNFTQDLPEEIVGDAAQLINFSQLAFGSSSCTQGNTFIEEYDQNTNQYNPYVVPISRLKSLSLGLNSGLYETNLFGFYESNYLINTSSYEVRTRRYVYSDNFFECGSDSTSLTYSPGFMGAGNGFTGTIVPWNTQAPATIEVSEFQLCANVTHLEFQPQ